MKARRTPTVGSAAMRRTYRRNSFGDGCYLCWDGAQKKDLIRERIAKREFDQEVRSESAARQRDY
jgi:hypothetical protein